MRIVARLAVLIAGVAAAVAIAAGLSAALTAQSGPFGAWARSAFDATTAALSWVDDAGAAPRVTFLDVDDLAYRALGAPAVTPRGAVATLLGIAAAGGAEAIVIDIDLTQEAVDPDARDALVTALEQTAKGTPTWLVRAAEAARRGGDAPLFDALVERLDGLRWGGGEIAFDVDGLARRAPLGYCSAAGAVPAVFALGVALGGAAEGALRRASLEDACAGDRSGAFAEERLITYPFRLRGADGRIGDQPGLRRIGAGPLLRGNAPLGADGFSGELVIIGASHGASGDLVQTPVGAMPGSLLIANAIGGWLRLGAPLQPPSLSAQATFAGLLAVIAFAAIRLRGRAARGAGFARRALLHPVLVEKALLAGLTAIWLALLPAFLGQGLWLGALAGAAAASFIYFIFDDLGGES